ncbi:hypothetical protein CVM73_35250 [Bradyrhizobium forestalis]|uniref:Uncharacterized protein n=1 Tax=Bradyrhizobium forestalis TaxID=1419263 RepID=A0A2M8QYL3_9BRAD|nr:hypothetical protein CVM73_35250 [Bradyrhizobium forestalis]
MTSALGVDVTLEDSHLEQTIERAIAGERVDALVARLRTRGVAAQRLESVERVCARSTAMGDGTQETMTLVFERDEHHPSGHPVELIGRCAVRCARAGITSSTAPPNPAADTRSVLAELGYSEQTVRDMFDSQEVSESWATEYLPP